jgi:eukaryotic-like serine/threonine-protein kinase
VYLARDERREGALVALKVLRPDRLGPGGTARLQEEFRELATIRHPRIAGAHDFGFTEEGRLPCCTREYIRGTPVPPGPPPEGVVPREHLAPILDLLEALAYLHDHGILHLDIHAGNLIVSDDPGRGSVLIDFGLLRSAGAQPSTAPRWPAACSSTASRDAPRASRGCPGRSRG